MDIERLEIIRLDNIAAMHSTLSAEIEVDNLVDKVDIANEECQTWKTQTIELNDTKQIIIIPAYLKRMLISKNRDFKTMKDRLEAEFSANIKRVPKIKVGEMSHKTGTIKNVLRRTMQGRNFKGT